MDIAVVRAVEELRGLTVAELQEKYREVFGERASRRTSSFCSGASPGNCRHKPKEISATASANVPQRSPRRPTCALAERKDSGVGRATPEPRRRSPLSAGIARLPGVGHAAHAPLSGPRRYCEGARRLALNISPGITARSAPSRGRLPAPAGTACCSLESRSGAMDKEVLHTAARTVRRGGYGAPFTRASRLKKVWSSSSIRCMPNAKQPKPTSRARSIWVGR